MNIYQLAFFSLNSDAKAFPELEEIKKDDLPIQCCGSGSVSGSGVDPDSMWSLDPDSQSGSGSRRAKMTHKIEKS
jgi:hypothetical protein